MSQQRKRRSPGRYVCKGLTDPYRALKLQTILLLLKTIFLLLLDFISSYSEQAATVYRNLDWNKAVKQPESE